ncbi:TMV resistance protein N-like isoform X2 [Malus sylvestris]|uniref:TMV resistance protein N-like isoform X2 n=1 Tax=Malus sylvestris TaxID=3752 RepID=UPI0021AC18AA|nr:TMV resistance protein N-like isoform X2 [Malus sylvestris]
MANQPVPSSSFSTTPSWTYDVFLSYRGADTRINFADHLYQALVRHEIRTFFGHIKLPIGEEISQTILEAIENSRISVIIFSKNYAFSRWCLDELVYILECRKSRGQMTRPIFYKVDPSDVRHQRNSYAAAFAHISRKYENNLEKVQRWRTALTEAANLKGATLNEADSEAQIISDIVKEIHARVNDNCLSSNSSPSNDNNDDQNADDNVGSVGIVRVNQEPIHSIFSPDGKFRRSVTWRKLREPLGSGSYGTVYEGLTEMKLSSISSLSL